ncbi:MAG: hypothetical protein M1816_001002 [Peltula sp. TS41687]|nr:MAG: hypothetical protein M1816_001002 [Peltula sp. TS41687]
MDAQAGIAPSSISARIAALRLDRIGLGGMGAPTGVPNGTRSRVDAPPSMPVSRPAVDSMRRHTANNPPLQQTNGLTGKTGNQPNAAEYGGAPQLPPRRPTIAQQQQQQQQQDKSVQVRPPPPPPPPPPRESPTRRPKPPLPPRGPSAEAGSLLRKRGSIDSVASTVSSSSNTFSSVSTASTGVTSTPISRTHSVDVAAQTAQRVKAPAYDPASLPPLPAKKKKAEKWEGSTARGKAMGLEPSPARGDSLDPHQRPLVRAKPPPPPRLSSRRMAPILSGQGDLDGSKIDKAKPSALSLPLNESTETPPAIPSRRPDLSHHSLTDEGVVEDKAPPIPLASRPTLAQINRPHLQTPKAVTGQCLKCRDFSEPDRHAARFPRQSIPSTSIDWLAHQLTSPFPSLTDKARVIFTWLHHNIDYDVQAFFNNNVQHSTPSSTLSSGLAVCGGYAGLFTALASKAGLESVVIGGHGKGYGFTPVGPNSPIPPYSAGHAWNAVKIDDGEWKLIDCCWGAGHVSGKGQPYTRKFTPSFFTMTNAEFGLRHFPGDKNQFFLPPNQSPPSWEQYVLGGDMAGQEPVQVFSGAESEHGLGTTSFSPQIKQISVSYPVNPTLRFSFAAVCPHWSNERHGMGKPYQFILAINKQDGGSDHLPFSSCITPDAGQTWWLDIPVHQLGRSGQTVTLFAVTTVDGEDARGLTLEQFVAAKGRKAMGFGGVAAWELV